MRAHMSIALNRSERTLDCLRRDNDLNLDLVCLADFVNLPAAAAFVTILDK